MANKVIRLASTALSSAGNVVYADLSLDASAANLTYRSIHDLSGSIALLSADNGISYGYDQGHIQQNPLSGNISLFHGLAGTLNRENQEYNAQQRSKSHYKLDKNINVIAIKQAIHNIFTWTPGERILNPEFGNRLRSYLYEGITPYNQEQIMAEIRHCFTMWEPRAHLVKVINLTDVNDVEDNTVRMDIVYAIPSLTDEQFTYRYEGQRHE